MPGSAMKRQHGKTGSCPKSQEGYPKEVSASFKLNSQS